MADHKALPSVKEDVENHVAALRAAAALLCRRLAAPPPPAPRPDSAAAPPPPPPSHVRVQPPTAKRRDGVLRAAARAGEAGRPAAGGAANRRPAARAAESVRRLRGEAEEAEEETSPEDAMATFLGLQQSLLASVAHLDQHASAQKRIEALRERIAAVDAIIMTLAKNLRKSEVRLSTLVKDGKERVAAMKVAAKGKTTAADLVSYAQTVAYFTSAPFDWDGVSHTGMHVPPHPLAEFLRSSLLYEKFEREEKARVAAALAEPAAAAAELADPGGDDEDGEEQDAPHGAKRARSDEREAPAKRRRAAKPAVVSLDIGDSDDEG